MKSLQRITFASVLALAGGIAMVAITPFNLFAQETKAEEKVEVKELDSKTFDAELKNSKVPVLVDFTAVWCGPCQRLKPKVETLAQEFKGKMTFTKVEQTNSPTLTSNQGVSSWPTVKIYAPGGKLLATSSGDRPIQDLRRWVQDTLDAYNKSLQPGNGSSGGSNK